MQAAILQVKLKHLPIWTEKRRENAYLYNRYLMDSKIITPVEIVHVKAVYHLYVIRIVDGFRNGLKDYLNANGISTGIHYPIALPNLKAYAYLNQKGIEYPVATKTTQEILSLPLYPELPESKIEYISGKIMEFNGLSKRY